MSIESATNAAHVPPDPRVSIEPERVANPDATVAPFTDDVWPLDALPLAAGANRSQLTFTGLPQPWGRVARWLAYRWINAQTPGSIRDQANSRHVDFPSAQTIRQRVSHLRSAVEWLVEQGVRSPHEIDDDHLTDIVLCMRGVSASPNSIDRRVEVFKHWRAQNDDLPQALRLPDDLQVDLPAEARGSRTSENATRRVRQATMGPLLWWATRFVDEYSDLVFALQEHVAVPVVPPDLCKTKSAEARRVLDAYAASGQALPTWLDASGEVATAYLSWIHGVSAKTLAVVYSLEYANRLRVAEASDCPIVGFDRAMPPEFEPLLQYYDARPRGEQWPRLARLLQAACLIVVTYLTGMRSDEVRRLRPGCCPEPVLLPGGGQRHLVHGTVTKRQAEADGLLAGTREEVDAVWATVPIAARAVAVMERLRVTLAPGSEWLFNSPFGKSMLTAPVAASEIKHFISTINERTEKHPAPAPTIPLDTHGPVTLRRFRRTLAWFIRNQPEGEVTLSVQYQQVGTVVGGGYAAAGSTGWADILDEEGLETRRRVAENLGRELLDGAGISGPAAARAASAAAEMAGVSYLPDSEVRRLLKAPGMQIYDNKASLSLCMFDPDRALCQRLPRPGDAGTEPNLLGCRLGCTNRAMTDAHAELLVKDAEHLRVQAEAAPTPMRNRLNQAADEMDERAEQHWATRLVPTVLADEETA